MAYNLKSILTTIKQSNDNRKFFLKALLYIAGFKQICGHWVYIKILKNKPIVLDFGANHGDFSKEMQDHFNCECFLFEPNDAILNQSSFNPNNTFNIALTPIDCNINFYISENDEASSTIQSFQQNWAIKKQIIVEGLSLKSIIKKLRLEDKTIDIIKLDIEGSEIGFIESLDEDSLKNALQITIEFHDWMNYDLHDQTVNVINKLTNLGFKTYTDAKSHKEVIEMLFLRDTVKFSIFQKSVLSLYNRFKYLSQYN